MLKIISIISIILILLVVQLEPNPPQVYPPEHTFSKDQLIMYNEYANVRLNNGMFPQILSPELCKLAQQHSEKQNKLNKMYHSNMKITENVARGGTPRGTIDMWMVSPGHKRNLLSKYKYVGFGYAGIYGTSLHSDLK